MVINFIERLKQHIQKYVQKYDDRLTLFASMVFKQRVWFKGETLYFLHNEKQKNRIFDFDREVSIEKIKKKGRPPKVDFKVTFNDRSTAWIEIKHWLIGKQKGTNWYARTYFNDKSSVGINPDIQKLLSIPKGLKYALIFATANPHTDDWMQGITSYEHEFNTKVISLTDPNNYPPSFLYWVCKDWRKLQLALNTCDYSNFVQEETK